MRASLVFDKLKPSHVLEGEIYQIIRWVGSDTLRRPICYLSQKVLTDTWNDLQEVFTLNYISGIRQSQKIGKRNFHKILRNLQNSTKFYFPLVSSNLAVWVRPSWTNFSVTEWKQCPQTVQSNKAGNIYSRLAYPKVAKMRRVFREKMWEKTSLKQSRPPSCSAPFPRQD